MSKICKCGCKQVLQRRSNERRDHFNNRRYVNQSHANSHTQGAKNRARVKKNPENRYINGWALI